MSKSISLLDKYLTREQAEDARDYLEDKLPWGKLSKETQQALTVSYKMVEDAVEDGGRDKPFEKRRTTEQMADAIGTEHGSTMKAYDKLRNAEITSGLMERMPAKPDPDQPVITLRDLVEGAVDIYEEKEDEK